jgi:hypothetical protein
MRIKKDLIQLMEADYVPLQTSQEGLLKGGYGSIWDVLLGRGDIKANAYCPTKTTNQCTMNSCAPSASPTSAQTSPSTSPNPSTSPKPTFASAPMF